jgi:CDP-diacylglycerol--glycerol-3-phosphate 3-phosphatidyltransferase
MEKTPRPLQRRHEDGPWGGSRRDGADAARPIAGWQVAEERLHRRGNRHDNATFSPQHARNGMNLPNKLTISRFILTVAFLAVMFSQVGYHKTIALVLFIAAALSDFLDGEIARRQKLITNFGILMDPLADKIMVCSAFIAFIELNWISAWMVVVIVARELAITGMRLLAASRNVVLAAEGFGKHKTISQIVAIITILVLAAYNEWGAVGPAIFGFHFPGQSPWVEWFAELAKWVAVALTFTSGWMYLWRNRAIYLQDL